MYFIFFFFVHVISKKLTHFEFVFVSVHHHFELNLFYVMFVQMFDVHHAPGGILDADTSPVVVAYNAVAVDIHNRLYYLVRRMQVMVDRLLFVENYIKIK